jgi:hypothetical protein
MTDSMLHAALDLAGLGWSVFPCGQDKKPVIMGNGHPMAWSRWATVDMASVIKFWQSWPDANVGLACKPSHLIVLDIDTHDADGYASFDLLKTRFGCDAMDTRDCPAQLTPSGGMHILFSAADCPDIGNSTSRLAPGLDIRGGGDGCGGYIVLAPSRTANGVYRWVETNSPFDSHVKLAPFPQVLFELLRQPKQKPSSWRDGLQNVKPRGRGNGSSYAGAALAGESARVMRSTNGTRNHSLSRAAYALGRLVADGRLDASTVEETLLPAGMATGLTESECRATISSGLKARGVG